jgi:hypothetical protein
VSPSGASQAPTVYADNKNVRRKERELKRERKKEKKGRMSSNGRKVS